MSATSKPAKPGAAETMFTAPLAEIDPEVSKAIDLELAWKAAMAENSSLLSQGPAEKMRPSSAETLPRGPASCRTASKRCRSSVTRRVMASSP